MGGIASLADLKTAITSSTADAPVYLRLSFKPGDSTDIPPFECVVSAYNVPLPQTPGGPPPVTPPQPVQMYVVSTNGVFLHTATDTTIASRKGSLAFGTAVRVNPETTIANGYVWRIIAAGEQNAGLFVAEKSSDGATVILSVTKPNP